MRSDESGVAGFFEDLPVLAFVLCGVMLLVSSGLWTSGGLATLREDEQLQELASRSVERIVQRIESLTTTFETPMLEWMAQSNMSQLVEELLGSIHFSVNISSPHAANGWHMGFRDDCSGGITDTASASRLFNAQDSTGIVLGIGVRLIGWKD